MRGELTFERSTDYAAIRELLTEPSCYRRMTGARSQEPGARIELDVGPCEGVEYIIAREGKAAVAVFLLASGSWLLAPEVHFCFVPQAWGKTEPIARAFLGWVWENTGETRLVGPVPTHNRLAIQLARRVGFTAVVRGKPVNDGIELLEIRKP